MADSSNGFWGSLLSFLMLANIGFQVVGESGPLIVFRSESDGKVVVDFPRLTNVTVDITDPSNIHAHWWIAASSNRALPSGAFVAGTELNSAPLYLCRGEYEGVKHPGKVVQSRCNIGFGGSEIGLDNYEVLGGANGMVWQSPVDGNMPSGAVVAGYEMESPLYICRADYLGGQHPGKVVNGRCNFTHGGIEVSSLSYEILLAPKGDETLGEVFARIFKDFEKAMSEY